MPKQRFNMCIIDNPSKVLKHPHKVLFRDEEISMDEPSMMLSIPRSSDLDSTILTEIDRSDIISFSALMYGVSHTTKQPDRKKFKPIKFIDHEKSVVVHNIDEPHDLHDICTMEPTKKQSHEQSHEQELLPCIHENKSVYSSESTNEPTSAVYSVSSISCGNEDVSEYTPHRSGAFMQDIYKIISDTRSM